MRTRYVQNKQGQLVPEGERGWHMSQVIGIGNHNPRPVDPLLTRAIELFGKVERLEEPVTHIRNALGEAQIEGERRERKRIEDLVYQVHNAWIQAGHKDAGAFSMALLDMIKKTGGRVNDATQDV